MKSKYILILLIIAIFSSCEDMLDEEPKSFISPANFYSSPEEGYGALNSITGRLAWDTYRKPGAYVYLMPTDDHTIGRDLGNFDRYSIANYSLNSTNGNMREVWTKNYQAIYRANATIENLGDADFGNSADEKIRVQQIAEARFYRAWTYFMMAHIWGDLPIITKTSDIENLDNIPRSPVNEVYDRVIIPDLLNAQENLPSPDMQFPGRPSNTVASAYLALVYATRSGEESKIGGGKDEWNLAEQAAMQVVGKHTLFPTYKEVFSPENQNKGENMFSMQFYADGNRNNLANWWSDVRANGQNKAPLTKDLAMIYDDNDDRLYVTFRTEFDGVDNFNPKTANPDSLVAGKHFWWNGERNMDNNVTMMRYSNVLLLLAEAINEQRGPDDAYQYLDMVRTRAGLDALEGTGLTQEQFRDSVRIERRRELVFEYSRLLDLKRWGILIETIQSKSAELDNADPQPHHILAPIPQRELDLNAGLAGQQNPGY